MPRNTPSRRSFLKHGAIVGAGVAATRARVARAAPLPGALVMPEVVGDWWTVAGDPDLGKLTTPGQEPVDFGIWRAADGTWQIWSCIRATKTAGKTRLFHRWQGNQLTDRDWEPMGIAMQADSNFGETPGGLQAPFVLKIGAQYNMFYGDWVNICRATSADGKTFARQLGKNGKAGLFANQPGTGNTRDPMVIAVGGKYHCYTTAHPANKGSVYCRTSRDLVTWDNEKIVAAGGVAGGTEYSAECPFVYFHKPTHRYVLFRTQHYGKNAMSHVYCSPNPLDFGVNDDRYLAGQWPYAASELIEHEGETYVAALLPNVKGIQIARIRWVDVKA